MPNTSRPPLGKLEPGQLVMVHPSMNDSRRHAGKDLWISARVSKVGRVWVELERVGDGWPRQWRMRMDVQHEGTQYPGSNARFVTMEQHAWEETQAWALGVLREQGIDLRIGSPWRGREQELADLIVRAGRP